MGTAAHIPSSRLALTFTGQITAIAAMTIARLKHAARRLSETECSLPENWGDPWSHPEIRAMSMRQLADLPLTPPRRR